MESKTLSAALDLGFYPISSGVLEGRINNIHQEIKLLKSIVEDAKKKPFFRQLATKIINKFPCQHENYDCYVFAIAKWVRENIKYIKDITGYETLQTPENTLKIGGGDCDDHAILVATLLNAIGIKTAFKIVGTDGKYKHIYVIATTPKGKKWVVDTTRKNFFYQHSQDRSFEMELYEELGLGIPNFSKAIESNLRSSIDIDVNSKDYRTAVYTFNGDIQNVIVLKQKSKTPCIVRGNIYWNKNKLYVSSGCRAKLRISVSTVYPKVVKKELLKVKAKPATKEPSSMNFLDVKLESKDRKPIVAVFSKPIKKVIVKKQLSKTLCNFSTYGYSENKLWAKNGCRAYFRVYFDSPASLVRVEKPQTLQTPKLPKLPNIPAGSSGSGSPKRGKAVPVQQPKKIVAPQPVQPKQTVPNILDTPKSKELKTEEPKQSNQMQTIQPVQPDNIEIFTEPQMPFAQTLNIPSFSPVPQEIQIPIPVPAITQSIEPSTTDYASTQSEVQKEEQGNNDFLKLAAILAVPFVLGILGGE